MTISDTTIATVQSLQATLSALTALALSESHFPKGVELNDGDTFDFVVVGSGAGGSTIASRLTEDGKTTVALIEAGGIPPLESLLTGLFPLLVNSKYDWNITSTDDTYANQYLQNNVVEITAGKMLGGSSSLDHVMKVMVNEFDMDRFAALANDDSYKLENMLKYYTMTETLIDEEILSKYPSFHGTEGPLITKRDQSDKNTNLLASFKEAGNDVVEDINPKTTLGYNEPTLTIGDVWRQSAAERYLGRAKNRRNLYVQMNALATKIIINSSNIATGVEILTSDGTYKTINARKEVIVSCGTIRSPQLLMLSGIGKRSHLEEFDIEVKADLPVGDNLIDHASTILVFTLEESNKTAIVNPINFPIASTTGYVSLNGTKDPTYQTINFYVDPDYSGLMKICVWVYKFKNSVCEALYNANAGRALFLSVTNYLLTESRGTVRLNSIDPAANPTVYLGYLSNPNDLDNFAKSLQDIAGVVNTSYFKSINSEIIEMDLPECKEYVRFSFDYWKCYGRCMIATGWHYSSTCAVGKVLDNNMFVKGFENLRVVDASAMPYTVSKKIMSTVYAMSEKAADLIKTKWSLGC